MYIFLDVDAVNYEKFKDYLVYCWSVENLLFVERVCILYQIMLNYKHLWSSTSSDDDDSKRDGVIIHDNLHRISFKYRTDMYSHYENIIKAAVVLDKATVEEKKENFA